MTNIKDLYQSGDWKAEKHVPCIDSPGQINKGQAITITVGIGKEIAHPNTTEHHISWISVYFQPQGEKFPIEIGTFSFSAHGASAQGPNTSTVYTIPEARVSFKTEKSGVIFAAAYCNIHGLWESAKPIAVE